MASIVFSDAAVIPAKSIFPFTRAEIPAISLLQPGFKVPLNLQTSGTTGSLCTSPGNWAAKVVYVPCKVDCLIGIIIRMVALGSEHTVADTDDGEVLSWGGGGSGRLGHDHDSSICRFLKSSSEYTPRLIKSLESVKVKNVDAGLLHSACINENGSLYIFGEKAVPKLVWVATDSGNLEVTSTHTEEHKLASNFISNYILLSVGRVGSNTDQITQRVEFIEDMDKRNHLMGILRAQKANGTHGNHALTLIFMETKKGADA